MTGKMQEGDDGEPQLEDHNTRPLGFWSKVLPSTAEDYCDG